MQARCLRSAILQSVRSYATHADTTKVLPTANLARTQSAPRAVLGRREKRFGPISKTTTDVSKSGLTPSDKFKYRRLNALNRLPRNPDKSPMTEEQFNEHINKHRSRLRGVKRRTKNSAGGAVTTTQVVGQPVYLPNVIFRLIRNVTPEGQAYNPYEATFLVPRNITKTDVRSYLHAVYGLDLTYIRTTVYNSGSFFRHLKGDKVDLRAKGKLSNHKRVVVGLVDPFYYPLRTEDMSKEDMEEREVWIEENYGFAERAAQAETAKDASINRAIMRRGSRNIQNLYVPPSKRMEELAEMKTRVDARKAEAEKLKEAKRKLQPNANAKGVTVAKPPPKTSSDSL
ncbi:hypothetical protein DL96DRAFT_670143 [Flagelloscypha sp. PMI_526]|nr:hypothetical protein DL96DRAFT_670143 [Flagelloscypha sp. PMI_526]